MSVGHDSHSTPYFFLPAPQPRVLVEDGLCAVPDLWPQGLWDYSIRGETNTQREKRRRSAQRVCQVCPVRRLCAQYAADNDLSGVWGGVIFPPARRDSCADMGTNASARSLNKQRADGRSVGAQQSA